MKKDSRELLFERMEYLNPDFKKPKTKEVKGKEKINEDDEKWIQKAVNPEHKGYCTPMSKETCTPARKAFAMRAKHHELGEEVGEPEGIEGMEKPEKSIEEKYEELVTFVDDLYAMIHGDGEPEGKVAPEVAPEGEVVPEANPEKKLTEWNFDKKKDEKKEEKKEEKFEKEEDKESKKHEESETPAEEKKEHKEKKEFPFKKKEVDEVKDNSGKKVPVAAIAKVGK